MVLGIKFPYCSFFFSFSWSWICLYSCSDTIGYLCVFRFPVSFSLLTVRYFGSLPFQLFYLEFNSIRQRDHLRVMTEFAIYLTPLKYNNCLPCTVSVMAFLMIFFVFRILSFKLSDGGSDQFRCTFIIYFLVLSTLQVQ